MFRMLLRNETQLTLSGCRQHFVNLVAKFTRRRIRFSTLSLLYSVLYNVHFEPVFSSAPSIRVSNLLMTTPVFSSLGIQPRRSLKTLVERSYLASALNFDGVVKVLACHLMKGMQVCMSAEEWNGDEGARSKNCLIRSMLFSADFRLCWSPWARVHRQIFERHHVAIFVWLHDSALPHGLFDSVSRNEIVIVTRKWNVF